MWCVPTAVGTLLHWSREKVWLEILAERHERASQGKTPRRLTNVPGKINEPHGGVHMAEAIRVIEAAGFRVIATWEGTRRMTVREFELYRTTVEQQMGPQHWLVMQRSHAAAVTPRSVSGLIEGLPVAMAWRVERRTEPTIRISRPMIEPEVKLVRPMGAR